MPAPVNGIALAIGEALKIVRLRMENKDVWEMQKAIDAGEKYIRINEGSGEYEGLSDKKKKKYLKKYNKRFFKYN